MHPVIRILSLLAVLGFLARAEWLGMAAIAGVLALAYRRAGVRNLPRLLSMLARLRYFYLALVLVYGISTPGDALPLPMPFDRFTAEGLLAGLERVAALILIVVSVHWLLETTSRDELAGGLYWLLKPLAVLRVPVDRFVLRLVLTLERIEEMLEHARTSRRSVAPGEGRDTLLMRAARLFEGALERAEAESGIVVDLQLEKPPGWLQWMGWLVFVGTLFVLSQARNWA